MRLPRIVGAWHGRCCCVDRRVHCEQAKAAGRYARLAEESGFSFGLISDHFHPWIDRQGQSPFVWSVIGAIVAATERLELGTAVTCPSMRIHPALVAQAAATCALLMEGRFFLGRLIWPYWQKVEGGSIIWVFDLALDPERQPNGIGP